MARLHDESPGRWHALLQRTPLIGRSRPWRTGLDALQQFLVDDALTYSAGLAFHLLLALFPFLLCLLTVVEAIGADRVLTVLLAWVEDTAPDTAAAWLQAVLGQLGGGRRPALFSASIAGAVWAMSGGIRSAMRVIAKAYDIRKRPPLWRRLLLSIGYTILLMGAVVLAGLTLAIGPDALQQFGESTGLHVSIVYWWRWLRWPVATLLLFTIANLFYVILPRRQERRLLTPGALIAVLGWLGLAWGFGWYVDHLANYQVVYGGVGAMIVVLLYLWALAVILLYGAEYNAVSRDT